jgi:hypothetical protein
MIDYMWGNPSQIYLAPCHRQYLKFSDGVIIAPPDACIGQVQKKRFESTDNCDICTLEKFLNGCKPQTLTPQIPKEAQIYLASNDDEPIDDFMEYCAECRNVDIIKGGGVVCLGSEGYRKRKGCLDIEIKWRNPDKVKKVRP